MRLLFSLAALIAGVATSQAAQTAFATNATWRYFKGTSEASSPDTTAWRLLNYDDSGPGWLTGNGMFYYDSDVNVTGSTLLSDMNGGYSSLFLRRTFVIENPADVTSMTLSAWSDDGFIAWINGTEVTRYNMPAGPVAYNGSSSPALAEPIPIVDHVIPSPATLLVPGTNIITVHAFNSSIAGSSDFFISTSLRYEVIDLVPPTLIAKSPAPGNVNSLMYVSVTFSEPMSGVDAGDLLANGVEAVSVSNAGGTNYSFMFQQVPYGNVDITWNPNHGITDQANPPNPFDHTAVGTTWSYNNVDMLAPTITFRYPTPGTSIAQLNSIQLNFSEEVTGVDAADLLINGVPATDVAPGIANSYTFQFTQPPTGSVTVAFAANHGISDVANPANAFAGANWTYVLNPSLVPFRISEFLASNSGEGVNALLDEDLDASDWIEIYNPDSAPGDLSGWFLSDVASTPTKWRFPTGTTVPGRGYLIVFASSKNRTNNVARLHSNFSLSASGEFLGLFDAMTNAVSTFSPTYPAQREDVSYGRDKVNPSVIGFYTTPTPGADNATSGSGFLPEVVFSRQEGSFVGSFQLELSVPDTNAVIRYTIVTSAQDVNTSTNSIPTTASLLYTNPITINSSVIVRARAFPKSGSTFPGPVTSKPYIQLGAGASNFVSTLPVVVLHTVAPATISAGFPTPDNQVIFACWDTNNGVATLADQPQTVSRAGINYRGSSTQFGASFPKGSIAVELWDEFNADVEKPVLDLPAESDWVLYAPNQFDTSLMHNPLLHQWAIEMGYYSSRCRFVEVFFRQAAGAVTANTNSTGSGMGDYWGVYVLEEKVKRDGNRLDIDEIPSGATNNADISGGYLVKIDRTDANERTFVGGGVTITYVEPDGLEMVTAARAAQANYIKSYIDRFNTALTGAALTNATGTNHYSHYLNIAETIDLHMINVLTLNVDAYRLSGYIYKPRDGKMVIGPLWDSDRGQGTSKGDTRPYDPRVWQSTIADYGTDYFQGTTTPAWLGRMFTDPDLWQVWVDRWQFWRASVLDTNHIAAVIDHFGNVLRPAQVREQRRWTGGSGSDTSPRNGVVSGGSYSHTFNGTFQGEIDFQKRWYFDRVNFIDTNLLGRPVFTAVPGMVQSGSQVTLTDTSGKAGTVIYYTLDGTDPRASQGRTNPAAQLYTGPITITNNVRIRARAVNANHRNMTGLTAGVAHNPVVSTPWSGDNAATYYVAVPTLAVTEIMFNPNPASLTDTNDPEVYEYLELKNVGTNTLNLIGFRFTNGIDFTFTASSGVTSLAPGAYVLLVKDIAAFTARYGERENIAGEYGGQLANTGERLVLVGSALEPVLDFEYGDGWQDLADGNGFSLVLINESTAGTNYGNSASWRISNAEGGTPGIADPGPRQFPHIVVSEALPHTDPPNVDTIELQNLSATNVNVGGWFLSDSFDSSKKFVIPSPTIIPPGGFVTFTEASFGAGANGFKLSSEGDDVYVFSGDGTRLTGYYHGYDFGASANGVSFIRYVDSQTNEHFVASSANTLNASNALPKVGPVVITEIHYHPPEGGSVTNVLDNNTDEFIELKNIMNVSVPLYDTMHPSNTWALSSGADFVFPQNVSLPAGGYLLVVNFDPADTALLSEFTSKFGVAPGTPIYGPFDGNLNNGGESVKLSRPDLPNAQGGFVPYIEVDRITYKDVAPWPAAADGFGPSLQRFVPGRFGNDPTNWAAALPTPGADYVPGTLPVITQEPAGGTVIENNTITLTVAATGAGPLGYQWRFEGNAIPGATNATLTISGAQAYNSGSYAVAVFNAGGAVMSQVAVVSVAALPRFTLHPVSQAVQPDSTATFTAAASGTPPLNYQWRYEGIDIPGATSSNLVLNNVELYSNAGSYDVRVTDSIGSTISSPATLVVLVRPVITNAPRATVVLQGQTASFTVVAGPDHPLLPKTNTWAIFGQMGQVTNTSEATVYIVNATNSGFVRLRVANAAGQTNITSGLNVTVLADADRDGMADAWEGLYGFSSGVPADADADADGDGMSNRAEYIAGTHPLQASSYLKLDHSLAADGSPVLQFNAVSNRVYEIQASEALPAWVSLMEINAATNNRTITITNAAPDTNRFYRLMVPKFP